MLQKLYRDAFAPKHLLTTNTVICSTLLGTADALQQFLSGEWDPKKGKTFNWRRSVRMAVMGLALGPMGHFFYRELDARCIVGSRTAIVAKKITADMSVSPIFACTLIAGIAIQEGKSVYEALDEYRRKFFRIFLLDLCVWPPTQFFNFMFLPPSARVLYISVVQLVYNCFMSYIKHHDHTRCEGDASPPLRSSPTASPSQ